MASDQTDTAELKEAVNAVAGVAADVSGKITAANVGDSALHTAVVVGVLVLQKVYQLWLDGQLDVVIDALKENGPLPTVALVASLVYGYRRRDR